MNKPGIEIELIPYPDAVAIKTARFTDLDDGHCVEIDGAILQAALKAFDQLSLENVQRGKKVHFRVISPATQEHVLGSRKPLHLETSP